MSHFFFIQATVNPNQNCLPFFQEFGHENWVLALPDIYLRSACLEGFHVWLEQEAIGSMYGKFTLR